MKKSRFSVWLLLVVFVVSFLGNTVYGEESGQADLGIQSKAVMLMEASTGEIIYEKNSKEKLSPASITKIMTLILIFDALEDGKITLEDSVTTSAYAASMGGSQVFLEEGEVQTVETLIKCIIVSSGNDASVAMAEYIAGSEAEFVKWMNQRAQELGMTNTYFEDCCGLTDSDGHYTSAEDVAIMSRELIRKYPEIKNYSGIWMEKITHTTARGTSEFGLANTNKLLKQYQWATGLKTGSTDKAKYCVSATACKDGLELIAVVMAAPDYKVRFSEAIKLLEYGYSVCRIYKDTPSKKGWNVDVNNGVKEKIHAGQAEEFLYLDTTGRNLDSVEKKVVWKEKIEAPVEKGDVVGKIEYYLEEQKIGEEDIVATENAKKISYGDVLKKLVNAFWI